MRIAVVFRDGPHEFEVDDDRVVGHGNGPVEAAAPADLREWMRSAIERPLDFPALSLAIVPGDHVVIPVEPGIPGLAEMLDVLVSATREAGAGA